MTVGPRQGRDGRWRCFAACLFPAHSTAACDEVLTRAVECGLVAAMFDEFAGRFAVAGRCTSCATVEACSTFESSIAETLT